MLAQIAQPVPDEEPRGGVEPGRRLVQAPPTTSQARAFRAVLRRDMYVTGKELPAFLAQVILQPLFLLFVFGKVLAELGYTRPGYADLLFPGLLALTAVITGMQTLAFPLVVEFGWTKEIEDRLLAPMSTGLVAAVSGAWWLRSQLYGVSPWDPLTLIATALVLASVAAVASMLPARRATQVDPAAVLRSD